MRTADSARKPLPAPCAIRELLSYRLSRLAGLNDRSGHAHLMEEFGVTLGEWRVLAIVAADAPLTFADLARATLLDKGQLSRTVRRLATRGWVLSVRTKGNGRSVDLHMTAAGRRQALRISDFAAERNRVMLTTLNAAERVTVFALLDRLSAFVETEFFGLATASARDAERAASWHAASPHTARRRTHRSKPL